MAKSSKTQLKQDVGDEKKLLKAINFDAQVSLSFNRIRPILPLLPSMETSMYVNST